MAMERKEIDCGASEMPRMTPVSCTGKEAFGDVNVEKDRADERCDCDEKRDLAKAENKL